MMGGRAVVRVPRKVNARSCSCERSPPQYSKSLIKYSEQFHSLHNSIYLSPTVVTKIQEKLDVPSK